MKNRVNRVVAALLLSFCLGVVVVAGTKSETITLGQDMKINGSLVKKGTYKAKFDEQTNELTIYKGKEVVARATGRIEKRARKAPRLEINSARQNEDEVLISLTFSGSDEKIIIGESGSSVGSDR